MCRVPRPRPPVYVVCGAPLWWPGTASARSGSGSGLGLAALARALAP
jgi:hypothetical protein